MITVNGLVVAERSTGETGKTVMLLTGSHGCIEVYVRGGKKSMKSISSTQLFCYAKFSLDEKRDAHGITHYYYNSSVPIRIFYDIRLDAKKTSLACYFAELLKYAAESAEGAEEIMRLTLNTLHFLNNGKREPELLKCIFELRLLCETGFRPALIGCHKCYKVEDDEMHFDIRSGLLTCSEHFTPPFDDEAPTSPYDIILNKTRLYAIRYIALVDYDRLFNFRVSGKFLAWLSEFTENFAEYHYGKSFDTLKFYKMM